MKTNNVLRFIKKSELCDAIHLMSKDVDLVAIINKNGRIVESKFGKDTALSCLSENQLEMIAMQRSLQTSMIKEFDQSLSSFHQTVTIRESHVEFVCNLDEEVLLVISNANVDVKQFSTNMSSLVSEFQTPISNVIVV
ncbi:hypothetical protein YTPLAS73_09750 [Nitrosarchaeum sp.]|nr:hypothetical protein YTPLAS73_09750 [Nitrosarchaeum sp.]